MTRFNVQRGLLTFFTRMGLVSLCLLAVNPLGAAEEIPVLEVEERSGHAPPRGWQLTTHHGTADISMVRETIGPVLKLHSNSSSFSVQKKIEVDLRRTPWLTWDWKVTPCLKEAASPIQMSTINARS